MFLRLNPASLPPVLADHAPELLWLGAPPAPPPADATVLVTGTALDDGANVPLAAAGADGRPHLLFNALATLRGTVLEHYRTPPAPTLEMRLPFNYSLLPNWLKGIGRVLRGGQLGVNEPTVAFPAAEAFPADFLYRMAAWAGLDLPAPPPWGDGCRAAAFVSHDVDVDWLFHHPDWLERILDIEEEHGFTGVWFVVPRYCRGKAAERALTRIRDRGHELGCHGYNHDAKLPFVTGAERRRRLKTIAAFAGDWQMAGFRSEWLWRTPQLMTDLSEIFRWDSSVPAFEAAFSHDTYGGCGTMLPFVGLGGMVELPLTLAMDVDRVWLGQEPVPFWHNQLARARGIAASGGLVVATLHPQPHQGANAETLQPYGAFLKEVAQLRPWRVAPSRIAELWATQPAGGSTAPLVRPSTT